MCTLIIGRDVVAPESVLLAANRDEDPARPSEPPGVLLRNPRVVGGRDRLARGTWLAIRERRAVVAMLNRRDKTGQPAPRTKDLRSRGLLTVDVASVSEDLEHTPGARDAQPVLARLRKVSGEGLPLAALAHALASITVKRYAPFNLVYASPGGCWLLMHDATETPPLVSAISPGWHVITHMNLDDPSEPRTAALLGRLADFRPRSLTEAEALLGDLLRSHGVPAEVQTHAALAPSLRRKPEIPPVCLHEGRMVTVSSAMVYLARDTARYLHAEGRPCEDAFLDMSELLADEASAPENA